jgi:hypothetical protein
LPSQELAGIITRIILYSISFNAASGRLKSSGSTILGLRRDCSVQMAVVLARDGRRLVLIDVGGMCGGSVARFNIK